MRRRGRGRARGGGAAPPARSTGPGFLALTPGTTTHRDEDFEDDLSEDLETALRSIQLGGGSSPGRAPPSEAADEDFGGHGVGESAPGEVTRMPEVVDDFIRNFLVKVGLTKTLGCFETEWYELKATGQLKKENIGNVPDIYKHNQQLDETLKQLRGELAAAKSIAAKATATWDKFRKERDFHRMHHKRIGQEKNKLVTDLKRLRKHYSQYEPTIKELRHKYEVAMKEKMLMRLERDRLSAKVEGLTRQVDELTDSSGKGATGTKDETTPQKTPAKPKKASAAAVLPSEDRPNPYLGLQFEATPVETFALGKTFKGHLMPVSSLEIHPKKPVIATASDDNTWKLWSVPNGELIMSGEGHKDWVAGIAFHPSGTQLASASGDCTVKLWDFEAAKCSVTFTDHTQAVWDVAFHDTGDFMASCSLDHSARLWDLRSKKCKMTFRGHVDSVNSVCWQPFTNNLCTGSSDKTVSLWDARSGLCAQTFYGHHNSCNSVHFNLRGDTVASCDADGVVKLWDVRMVAEIMTIDCGPHAANQVTMDRSGSVLAVASDSGNVHCLSIESGAAEEIITLSGHEDAVQAVVFDPYGKYLASAGSDMSFRFWSR